MMEFTLLTISGLYVGTHTHSEREKEEDEVILASCEQNITAFTVTKNKVLCK